jgi:hypothetical protein
MLFKKLRFSIAKNRNPTKKKQRKKMIRLTLKRKQPEKHKKLRK